MCQNLLEEVLEECGAGHEAAEAAGDESPHLLCILQFLVLPCLVDNLAQNLITETLIFQALSNTTISHHWDPCILGSVKHNTATWLWQNWVTFHWKGRQALIFLRWWQWEHKKSVEILMQSTYLKIIKQKLQLETMHYQTANIWRHSLEVSLKEFKLKQTTRRRTKPTSVHK